MELTGKNLIGNKFAATGSTKFNAEDPSTAKILDGDFFEATREEISEAIDKAHIAFQIYRNKPGCEKADFLDNIAAEILALGDALIRRCMAETGLPEARLTGERGRTVSQLKLFAELLREGSWVNARIDKADPERKPLPKPDVRSMYRALGPVGVFGASNFPLAFSVAGGDTVSALAAGCPVVFKAHPAHPGTCELVATAILNAVKKSGMPDGTFSMLHGKSVDVGMAVVRHPLIKAIGFTGSYKGGKAIFDEANKRPDPIPVYAEMGSSNPFFILPGAMKERNQAIANDLAASVTLGVGQFCTNPGLVLVQESEEQKTFKDQLAKNMAAVAPGVMLSLSIHKNYQSGIDRVTKTTGVKALAQAKDAGDGYRGAACMLESSADSFLKDHSLEEEIFGPSTLVVTARDRSELIRAAGKLGGHLTATIHGTEKDLQDYADLISILEQKVGRIIFNGYPTGVEVCHAMVHGGPFPATSDSRTTSVGTSAITRFARPVCYQNFPDNVLPDELKNNNPLGIMRLVDSEWKK